MRYQVSIIGKTTLVADTQSMLRIAVNEYEQCSDKKGMAYGLATLYKISGGFIPVKVYVFSVVDKENQNVANADVTDLKEAMDFYFRNILSTNLYIKEVPKDSAMFVQEARRLYGDKAAV